MFLITDETLDAIDAQILSRPPEVGGALLGPPGIVAVTTLILDDGAETTPISYTPSRTLTTQVRAHEAEGLELKGLLHSHPGSLDRLSAMDRAAMDRALDANRHLASLLCPIATARRPGVGFHVAEHETPTDRGKVSWFAAQRNRDRSLAIATASWSVLPIGRSCLAIERLFGVKARVSGLVLMGGRSFLGRRFDLQNDVDLNLLFGFDYPTSPPLAILGIGGSSQCLSLRWRFDLEEPDRIVAALRDHFVVAEGATRPFRLVWGPAGGEAFCDHERTGRAVGWAPVCTNADVVGRGIEVRDQALARTAGLLPASLQQQRILLAGVGSVGSYMAEQFVRSGVNHIVLIDPETVELPNLSRTTFRLPDVGKKKVVASARQLLEINPVLQVQCVPSILQDLGIEPLARLVMDSDIVVSAIDDRTGPRLLDRLAYALGKPAVFVGLYAGARGGEIVFTVPERTACLACATKFRRSIEATTGEVTPKMDYGTGRLVGEVALGVDVHHVASAATKLALSLLLPDGTPGGLTELATKAVAAQTPYILMGMTPDYWIFRDLLRDVPGQHAFQTVWAQVERDPECTICGDPRGRIDPRQAAITGPSTAGIAAALAQSADVAAAQPETASTRQAHP